MLPHTARGFQQFFTTVLRDVRLSRRRHPSMLGAPDVNFDQRDRPLRSVERMMGLAGVAIAGGPLAGLMAVIGDEESTPSTTLTCKGAGSGPVQLRGRQDD